jgi:hypothetical protein
MVFLAICILGCDVLLYILFQWIYGEKYRDRSRRLAARRKSGPVLVDSESAKSRWWAFSHRASNSRT